MLKVEYFGHFCFKVRGKRSSVVIDPFSEKVSGLSLPERKGDLVLVTKDDPAHNNVQAVHDFKYVATGPGEYEVEGIHVLAGTLNGATFYQFIIDGVSFMHLGPINDVLTDEQLAEVGETSVLFVPVGGVETIEPEKAAEVVAQIEPGIVIPMNYKMDYDGLRDLAAVEKFIEEMGEELDRREELKLRSNVTLDEDTEVVVLELA
ncbi:MAG: MBL fold metallo-hydrolase [Patescibacteria group bacterium]|nr:MBL fold metallo-hydrolase [Patescibacteria group bacterium]